MVDPARYEAVAAIYRDDQEACGDVPLEPDPAFTFEISVAGRLFVVLGNRDDVLAAYEVGEHEGREEFGEVALTDLGFFAGRGGDNRLAPRRHPSTRERGQEHERTEIHQAESR